MVSFDQLRTTRVHVLHLSALAKQMANLVIRVVEKGNWTLGIAARGTVSVEKLAVDPLKSMHYAAQEHGSLF